jgi:hypothetical protein
MRNLNQLRADLIAILRKMPAMPPLSEIYVELKGLLDKADDAQSVGDFSKCVVHSLLALKYSARYAYR